MITAKTLVLENSFTSAEWAAGVTGKFPANPVLPNKVIGYDSTVRHYKMGDGVTAWDALPFWEYSGTPVLSFYYLPGDPALYNLTPEQVEQINAFGRYPNFVAVINGVPFPDIQPFYNGSPGFFTGVSIDFHNDGSGNNLDTTYVQFS